MSPLDESGDALEPCPKCGTTSVNCPLTADQGMCAYDDLYAPEDDANRQEVALLKAQVAALSACLRGAGVAPGLIQSVIDEARS